MAASGSASQLASRTAAVAVADAVSRWPARVRSGEGHPLALLRARLPDWGDDGRLLAISSPVVRGDAISLLYRDGDRRRVEYVCEACGEGFPFAWDRVGGREKGEIPSIACSACGAIHDEPARRRMLRTGRWVPQRADPTDEDVISFHLSRIDSRRATLKSIVREFRLARLAVERGDPHGLKTFRNVVLGLPGESGAADVDKLFELRGRGEPIDVEQVCAGMDVQGDRLVYVVLGFPAGNTGAVVLDFGDVRGDPDEDECWSALASSLARPFGGLPVTCISVDAGFLTSTVKRQCHRRGNRMTWWVATVGRAGEGKPIAKRIGPTGLATMGKDDVCAWWSGRVNAGHVRLPADITRSQIAELCAAEALTAEGGKLRRRAVENRPNHAWDAAGLAVHSRHFHPLGRLTRRLRLVAV